MRARHNLASEGMEAEPHHPIARRDADHVRSSLRDPAADLATQRGVVVEDPHTGENVSKVEPRRLDRNANLSGGQGSSGYRFDPHAVKLAARIAA